MFDIEKYAAILDELIINLQNVKSFQNHIETNAALENICRFLRIGKLISFYFQTPAHEMSGESRSAVMYDGGNADESDDKLIKMREPLENGAVTHYIFFPIIGEDSWTTTELEKIDILKNLVCSYTGRSNLLLIASNLTYNDLTLKIHNLAFFMRKCGEFMARRIIGDYAAVHFNLRRFSLVNNQVGREEGTEIMKKYVHGLKDSLSPEEYVCRVGGDNFVVLFLKKNLELVSVYLSGVKIKSSNCHAEFLISAYAGFYMIDPEEIKTPDEIMEKIATTTSIAKKGAGSPFIFYNSEIAANLRRAQQIENMVPDALKNREFIVYYQPKILMKNYTLSGAEALCRWKHDGELIPPFRFIPILERSKLICELDFYMLDCVCSDIRRWLDEGKNVVKISVNLSRVHLGDANLLNDIIGIIDNHNVPHKYIEIELTETTTDVDFGELKKVVTGLREAGISTSVDDFGIGYSSLNLIRELPWNVLKIDKSFLPDGTGNEKQKMTMLKYVIAMAQELGLECIVEGVETREQVMLLKENSCFLAQGYYFDKPLPIDVFEERLKRK